MTDRIVQSDLFGGYAPPSEENSAAKAQIREGVVPVKAHLRRVLTRKEETGEERFRVAVATMEGKQAQARVLDYLRACLVGLSINRKLETGNGAVSADDARSFWNAWAERPKDVAIDKLFGAIFKTRGWWFVGFTQSKWPGNNARTIRQWVWNGEDSAGGHR